MPIESDVALTVYSNTAYRGMVTLPPDGASVGDRSTDAAADEVAGFVAADLDRTDRTTWEGRTDRRVARSCWPSGRRRAGSSRPVPTPTASARRRTAGRSGSPRGTPATPALTHDSPAWYAVLLGAQILLWLAAIVWVRRTSPRRGLRQSNRAARNEAAAAEGAGMTRRWPALLAIPALIVVALLADQGTERRRA